MGRISKSIFFISVIFSLSPVREPLPFMGAQTSQHVNQVKQQLIRQQTSLQPNSDVSGILQSLSSLLDVFPQSLRGSQPEPTQPVVKTVPKKQPEKEQK